MGLFNFQSGEAERTAYDFTFKTLTGEHTLPLTQFRNKVLLVVNTASECGFTSQYEGLEALFRKYGPRGFVVLGVPCNDFGHQEPGNSDDILNFCTTNYSVSFPMADKEHVRGGNAHPFYRWVSSQAGFLGRPRWNFYKYLIDRHGRLAAYFPSTTPPGSAKIQKAIETELNKP